LAAAVHALRYWPIWHDEVSQATQVVPTLKKPEMQLVWQLVGSPWLPALVKTPLAGRLVQGEHTLSLSGPHVVRYWPLEQVPVVQRAHDDPYW